MQKRIHGTCEDENEAVFGDDRPWPGSNCEKAGFAQAVDMQSDAGTPSRPPSQAIMQLASTVNYRNFAK